ncbi:hypothetical protein SLEP1_g39423 [Rubroshorea leprosula]|uniref:Polygalacturonase n=1 Tax=Rubroshorea leprosula TaxID=152421 RepID=A0AAV5L054_9ROSI|nr:hypothetical protein SLEP1_g39423 [Rubroshorea leprosula]
MGSKFIEVATLLMLALVTKTQAVSFDVKRYGAKANGNTDDATAINNAWKDACAATDPSTVVIGEGTYMAGSLTFQGPCKNPVTVQVKGTIKAPKDTAKLKGQDGWVVFQNVKGLTVNGGGSFDGQGSVAWSINDCAKTGQCNALPINLRLTGLANSKFQDVTSIDSKLFHMNIINCNNLTLQHITINAPDHSLNTDGIHIGRSKGVNITGADIKTGDDCVSLGDGAQQINVENVKCGPGHGISVGSLGKYQNEEPVIGVTVRNCTITNTMNGVRIKTWPGSPNGIASNLHFEDIVMNNVSTPILVDQTYCPYGQCEEAPSKIKISDISFKNIRGTSATQLAVRIICSKGIPCKNVAISDVHLTYNGKEGPATSECANVQPTVTGVPASLACAKSLPS